MINEDPRDWVRPPTSPFHPGDGWITTAEKILVACLVVLIASVVGFAAWAANQFEKNRDEILASQEVTAENRAVGCRILIALNQELEPDGSCFEPEVLEFYNPEDGARPISADLDLVCEIAAVLEVPQSTLGRVCTTEGRGGDG